MAPREWVGPLVGIAAISAICVAWYAWPTPKPDPPNSARPAGSSRPPPSRVSAAVPPPEPALPARPELPAAAPAEVAFEAQARDADWAPGVEDALRRRLRDTRARLVSAECRQSQCRLVVAGTEAEIGQAIAELESERGLRGYASAILLTAPRRRADGVLELRAFATFYGRQ